jgi:hypothetical protein
MSAVSAGAYSSLSKMREADSERRPAATGTAGGTFAGRALGAAGPATGSAGGGSTGNAGGGSTGSAAGTVATELGEGSQRCWQRRQLSHCAPSKAPT